DFSDSEAGLFHDVGSIKATSGKRLEKQLLGFDCPPLKGLWLSPPYLHDGSAKTLYDALASDDGTTHHASLSSLSQQELDDLVAYLLQLDDSEESGFPFMKLKFTSPDNYSVVKVNSAADVKLETNLQEITEIRYYLDGSEFARTTSTDAPVSYTFAATGEYKLQAKVYHSGGKLASLTSEIKITVLEDACDFGIKLMPNPVSGFMRITTNGINSSHVRLFDASGKKWIDGIMENTSEVFDFSGMPHGVYLLVIEKDGCRKVKKVVRYAE
ncbi:MAG TPA: T9SS type A sorting domain-containing protein, partial [Chitinophagales bacterium]|nr:T9SS type A sorting domain-containing protein [Chitinophagales bacterium]